MKLQGKVVNWNDNKGFGFVEPNGGGERTFVHIKAFKPLSRRPINDDVIIYELVYDNNNRYKAENIKFSTAVSCNSSNAPSKSIISKRTSKNSNKKRTSVSKNTNPKSQSGIDFSFVFFIVFWCSLGVSVLLGKIPSIIIGLYILLSTITFITYWIDKSAAKNNRWRISENTLHLLSFLGGWPGAYLAQNILRHKSIKKQFKQVYWLTVMLNIGGLIWLYIEKGAEILTLI